MRTRSTSVTTKVLSTADKALRISTSVASVFGASWILVICVLMVVDIVGRQFGFPVVGSIEFVQVSIVAIGFLTIPYAMRKDSHVRSTILQSRLPGKWQRAFGAIFCFIGFVLFVFISVSIWEPMLHTIRTGQFEGAGSARIPLWPMRTIVFAGSVLMAAECLRALLTMRTSATSSSEGLGV